MSKSQIEDFLSIYPDQTDQEFQQKISSIKEFQDLASTLDEPMPKRGEYFRHQILLQILMLFIDEILLIWEMGSGKTCGIAACTEFIKNIARDMMNNVIANSAPENIEGKDIYRYFPYRRVLMLVSGDVTEQDLKFQLFCKCTGDVYDNDVIKNSMTEKSRKANITVSLQSYYDIDRHISFARKLKQLSDEQIIKQYSGYIIIIDEAHKVGINDKGDIDSETYSQYWRLLHLVKRRKIILLTGTPMINQPKEIIPLMNLILPANMQMSSETDDLSGFSDDQLMAYFNGRISYVRSLNKGVVLHDVGVPLTYDGISSRKLVYPGKLEGIQHESYMNLISSGVDDSVGTNSRLCANFVFPDGSYGGSGFSRYVKHIKDEQYEFKPDVAEYVRQNLKQLSIKMFNIIQDILNNPKRKRYVWFNYIEPGVILFGLCLELFGFTRYIGSGSSFVSRNIKGLRPFCSSPDTDLIPTLDKKPRFMYLTSKTPKSHLTHLFDMYNCKENVDGEYVLIVIGSHVSGEGVSFSDTREFDDANAWWNESTISQAKGRIVRATGYINTEAKERQKLIELGENPDDIIIDVNFRSHCTISDNFNTIDQKMYHITEEKDKKIARIKRLLKKAAVDCQLHRERNIRDTDIDYSRECDYNVCNYECKNIPPKEYIDMYDMLTAQMKIEQISDKIIIFFNTEFETDIITLKNHIKCADFYLVMSIQKLISENTPILNRNGIISYLRNSGDYIYLVTNKFENHSKDDLYYSKKLIVPSTKNFTGTIEEIKVKNQMQIIKDMSELSELDPNYTFNLGELLKKLSKKYQIYLFEKVTKEFLIDNARTMLTNFVFEKWRRFLFSTFEPIGEIEKTLTLMNISIPVRRGKHSVNVLTNALGNMSLITQDATGETVYLHTLYEEISSKMVLYTGSIGYQYKHENCMIRILKSSENIGWRNVADYEKQIYRLIIYNSIQNRLMEFENKKIYGIYIETTGEFKIRDSRGETLDVNGRSRKRGLNLKSVIIADLVSIIYYLNIPVPGYFDNVQMYDVSYIEHELRKMEKCSINLREIVKNFLIQNDMVYYT